MRFLSNRIILCLAVLFIVGCEDKNEKLSWLSSDKDSAYVQIERQLRGFDMAMKEVGYRYNELYFAGIDENWGYAQYHLEKIKTAIENGLERRPKRAASAKGFLEYSIPSLTKTIQENNKEKFIKDFETFRQSCIACHINEKVEFVKVVIPKTRLSPVEKVD
ncbi:MAG: hypothetical protein A2057_01685 [Ignavibacteria bacterium GWA2_35_9]|nr:MAG: hypothetical protein A2057_01685 [Ignavibacteria bacterium GWA2_35_9]OGU36595.1 MAG: hypothetical protein A2068_09820 [Ignavibacteria bacterium GWB2_35_6b]OGU52615.1 MAG: hypothetical protein A2080_04855 [Ignavibacteria bacterium GWC2_36_12]